MAYIWDAKFFPICYLGGEDRLFSKNPRAAKATFNGQGGGWKVAGKNCRAELLDFGHSHTFAQLKFWICCLQLQYPQKLVKIFLELIFSNF